VAQLFGFEIRRAQEEKEDTPSFVSTETDDGAISLAAGGGYGQMLDLEGTVKTESELVTRYRKMAMYPECESAIDDIVNDSIVTSEEEPVSINLDDIKASAGIKKKIQEEFDRILTLMDFEQSGYDIFKKWYVDGRLYYHAVVDREDIRAGIKELRYIDPRKIRKVRETKKTKDKQTGIVVHKKPNEYFIYNEKGFVGGSYTTGTNPTATNTGVKIAKDSVLHITSGLTDENNKQVLSHLHKAIKPLNQLRMLEDAVVIYRITRAPERRIFYIDVGNLPKIKAEQYLRDMMVKHKNRLIYDAGTGEVRDDRKHMTMMEDYWLPRREGGRGTEISTLPGGQNLGEMADVEYFQKKLYKSLYVPISRMEQDNNFTLGRSSEISRDEVKFAKFIERLRNKFSQLFHKSLRIQLILKGVITEDDWNEMKFQIRYDFKRDNYFAEAKDTEMMQNRFQMLQAVEPYIGKFISEEYVKKTILRMTDEDISQMDQQMNREGGSENQDTSPDDQQEQIMVANTIPFEPDPEPTEEEKKLVEQMTNFMNNLNNEDDSILWEDLDE